MRSNRWTWALAAVAAGAVGEIAFGPEPGTELGRRWSESLRLEVDELRETIGGTPVDLPFDSIEFEGRRAFELSDVLARSEGGRPVDLTRSFTSSTLGLALRLDGRPVGRVAGGGGCDGSDVRFVYDPEDERYTREREAGKLDPGLLSGLEPDLDLLELLPPDEVEEGATWKLDPEVLRRFFAAGGELGFDPHETVAEMEGVPREILVAGALASLHELFGSGAELSGKVEGRFVSTEAEKEGASQARLELALELALEADLGERFRALLVDAELSGERALHLRVELEGQLVVLWDLAGKHLRSARFEGDASLTGHTAFPVQLAEGQPVLEFLGHYELSGAAIVELVVE